MPTCVHSPSFLREDATASSASASVSASLFQSVARDSANVDLVFEASATFNAEVQKREGDIFTLANGL